MYVTVTIYKRLNLKKIRPSIILKLIINCDKYYSNSQYSTVFQQLQAVAYLEGSYGGSLMAAKCILTFLELPASQQPNQPPSNKAACQSIKQ